MHKKKIIVVGAGVIGSATTFAFTQFDCEVLVVDRSNAPGMDSSYANGGMLTASMADPWNAPGVWLDLLRWIGRDDAPMLLRAKAIPSLMRWGISFLHGSSRTRFEWALTRNVRLAKFSLEMMKRWRDEISPTFDGAQLGTIKIYRDKAIFNQGVEKAKVMYKHGIEFSPLSVDRLVQKQPSLTPVQSDLAGALHFPDDEVADANKFSTALLDNACASGVKFRWKTDVKSIAVRDGKIIGVVVGEGEVIEADVVVIAAGAYSPKIVATAGVGLLVKPVKGYSITFCAEAIPEDERLSIPIIDDAYHAAITPLGGRLRVAGTAEFAGFDKTLTQARIDNLHQLLGHILPDQASILQAKGGVPWAGFRPMTACGTPVIGATRVEGLYLNCGHGHLGLTQAAGSGEALAQEIINGSGEFNLSEYG